MQAAQKPERKRFYEAVTVAEGEGGFLVLLDGRTLKTPGAKSLSFPSRLLAEAAMAEWAAQGENIVPESLPITRVANSALDGVAGREADVIADIARYASSDLICYRAAYPPELVAEQHLAWDPILAWVRKEYDAVFLVSEGVNHIEQPASSLEKIRAALAGFGPFQLAALHIMTSITGSALLVLAHAAGRLDLAETWAAAHVDEDWQITHWGEDFEAAQRRKKRFRDFEAASAAFRLVSQAEVKEQE
jgi:chaperone required for assembly of F1-ATPase